MYIDNNNKMVNALTPDCNFQDEKISCFISISGKTPAQITWKQWFSACMEPKGKNAIANRDKCLQYRKTGNKEIKLSMGAISPGAIITRRDKNLSNEEQIEKLTGWMPFDIDPKDNPHITNAGALRDELKKLAYVAYCSLSASGKGVWGLVKVKSTKNYKLHFEQLKRDFASLNIKLDSSKGGNPTDLRIYSYDPDAYIAENYKIYDRIYKAHSCRSINFKRSDNAKDTQKQVEDLIIEIQKNKIDIAPNYSEYLNLGFAFANEFGEHGRNYYHTVCSISEKYNVVDADTQFDNCLRANTSDNVTSIASFFYFCKEAGMSIKSKKVKKKHNKKSKNT